MEKFSFFPRDGNDNLPSFGIVSEKWKALPFGAPGVRRIGQAARDFFWER
ncbi:MAG: hypothetical protein H7Z39_16615 [Burkholderiaceae bacterium]|nr:hypothetical protein [Burkholderiaceae bacterium]